MLISSKPSIIIKTQSLKLVGLLRKFDIVLLLFSVITNLRFIHILSNSPAYWGILDLTGESLYDCKQLSEEDISQLSQEFSDDISWKTMSPEKNIRQYFDSNCEI